MPHSRNILVSVIFRIVVCSAVLVVAIGVAVFLVSTAPKPPVADLSQAVPRLQVMQAQPVPIRRQWEGFGTATAMDTVNVPSRVTAVVAERPAAIRAGQRVAQGELIVKLDDSDFLRQVEVASQSMGEIDAQLARLAVEEQSWTQRAKLSSEEVKLIQADYDRVHQAFERDVARQRELDQAQRLLNTARQTEVATHEELDKIAPRRAALQAQRLGQEASLRQAAQNAERAQIVSPIDGILQSVDVEVGENITAGQRVARVVNSDRIEVPLLLPAAARPFIAPGADVELSDAGGSATHWRAKVVRIAPEDDEATRTLRVFVEVNNIALMAKSQGASESPGVALPPGKFVQGVVVADRSQPRWVVPRRAVDGQRLFLIESGVVRSHGIEVDFQIRADLPSMGLSDRQWSVLKDPLPTDALVVVDGSRSLIEGSPAVAVVQQSANKDRSSDAGAATP